MPDVDPGLLGVCSHTEEDRRFLCDALGEYFGGELTIMPLDDTALPDMPRPPKVILVSRRTREVATRHFPASVIIEARRIISGRNLEEVIKLPEGKSVLVANFPEATAREAVDNLHSLGIRHLDLVPYWYRCGLDLSRHDTVIYVGIRSYAPEGMGQYIDIGPRAITLPTLIEVLRIYGLPFSLADKFLDNYTRTIVEGCYRIDNNLREMRKLKDKFEQVCDSSNNVEIGIDRGGVIQAFNRNAERFFDLSKETAVGRGYADCLSDCAELLALLDQRRDLRDELANVRGRHCLISVSLLHMEEGIEALLTIVPLQDLQKAEAKARAGLHARGFSTRYRFSDIRGRSETLRQVVELARLYADTEATVLLSGESGTGKELFAQAIHNASARAGAPFVAVNFAAMPESLAESELFGHVEGAFTGATRGGKMGLFEIAHGGTIFLDEIGDVPLSMQSKLLRVLEEREVVRVGATNVLPVDVRVVCATNRDLEAMMRNGRFLEALYYRIRVLTLRIPPLRERKEDIPDILQAWDQFERIRGLLSSDIFDRLLGYGWPGNVRELKSLAEYLSILERRRESPPETIRNLARNLLDQFFRHKVAPCALEDVPPPGLPDRQSLEILRQISLLHSQSRSAGRHSLAELGVLRKLGLTPAKIRTRIADLVKTGYLSVGRTRQGVSLTPDAVRLLNNF